MKLRYLVFFLGLFLYNPVAWANDVSLTRQDPKKQNAIETSKKVQTRSAESLVEELSEENFVEVEPVVVTGTAIADSYRRVASNVQTIEQKSMRRSGAENLSQLLERTSAVRVVQQPGNFAQIWMRGFSTGKSAGTTISDQIIILIDGNKSGASNPANIPLDNIERVEVMRGSSSVLYGGSAVAGVINLITKRGSGAVQGRLGAEAGSYEGYNLNGGISGGIAEDALGYSIAAQLDKTGTYRTGKSTTYKNSDYHSGGVGGSLVARPTNSTSISAVVNWKKVYDTGSPGDASGALTPRDSVKNEYLYGALELKAKNDANWSWQTSIYAHQNTYEIFEREYNSDSSYIVDTVGMRNILGIPLPKIADVSLGTLALGVEVAREDYQLGGSAYYEPDYLTDTWSAFAEHKVTFDTLTLQNGIRYDYYDMESQGKDTSILKASNRTRSFKEFTWSSAALWWVTDWLGVRGSVGASFTPPKPAALSGDFTSIYNSPWGAFATYYKGDPNLDAEKSTTYDVGVKIEEAGFTANTGYFKTHYKGRIDTIPIWDGAKTVQQFVNFDKQHVAGIEANIAYTHTFDIQEKFSLTLAPYIAWEYLTERANKGSKAQYTVLRNVPKYNGLFGVGIGFDDYVWLDVNVQQVGKRRVTAYDYTTFTTSDKSMNEYHLVNARLSSTPLDNLEVYVDLRNIEDKYYEYTYGYPMPGRAITAGFSVSF